MKVATMVEAAEMLLKVYHAYTRRILSKITDPYLQTLVIAVYREIDLKQLLDTIKNVKDEYYKALANNYTESAYYLYQKAHRFYREFETKIIERLIILVKIYAIFLLKTKYNS